MIIARRLTFATAVAALAAFGCASLGLRTAIHGELAPWAAHFEMMRRMMGGAPNLSQLYGLVDATLSISCALAVFIAVLIALWFGLNIGKRVVAVDRGLASFAAGHFDRHIEERGSDEIERIAHSANLMARSMEHARDAERELVAGLAHDLAHPLTALRGSLEAACDRLSSEIEPAAAKRLLENVERVEATLSDLRDIASYDAGLIRLEWTTTDLAFVARDAVERYRDAASRRGIQLDLIADGPVRARTDVRRFERIVANLVVNALEATPPGGLVTLHALRNGEDAVFEVNDSAGADASQRLKSTLSGEARSGMGLRVVRALASAMQVRIDVQPTEGGSDVILRLPAVDSPLIAHVQSA
jgi:two-component system sensor histidine kinase BaeS